MNTISREVLETLTPQDAYNLLQEGNDRFVKNLKLNRNIQQQLSETVDGQFPHTVSLSCMDSRTTVEHIFDQGLGDMFSIRIAGNVINNDILGSLEYACQVAGSRLVMVLGHTRCGAVKGACDEVKMGNLTPLLHKILPAIDSTNAYGLSRTNQLFAEKVAYTNVLLSMEAILKQSDILKKLLEEGRIGMVGGMFSLESRRVHFIKEMFQQATPETNEPHYFSTLDNNNS